MSGSTAAIDWDELREQALSVLDNAHAAYSNFKVAAVVVTDAGTFEGVNVENASYGLTICAERNAVGAAVTAGARQVLAVCVICSAEQIPTPCGACRQVIVELDRKQAAPVRCYDVHGHALEIPPGELLPHAFELGEG